jgi:hypothetical protein
MAYRGIKRSINCILRRIAMKTTRVTLILVLAISLMAAAGCKKEPVNTPVPNTKEVVVPSAPKTEAPAAPAAPATPVTSALGFDASKSLDTVKADAAKMDLAQLTAVAKACKEAYDTKQLDLAKITEQLKNIPLTEKLGAESQKLTGEAKTAQEALTNIGAQLAVYVDKLKGMNADTSKLQVK